MTDNQPKNTPTSSGNNPLSLDYAEPDRYSHYVFNRSNGYVPIEKRHVTGPIRPPTLKSAPAVSRDLKPGIG